MSRHAAARLGAALLVCVLLAGVSATVRDVVGATPRLKNKSVHWTGDPKHRILELEKPRSQSLPSNASALLDPLPSDRCDGLTAPSSFTGLVGISQFFSSGAFDLGGKIVKFCADATSACQTASSSPMYSDTTGTLESVADNAFATEFTFTGGFTFPYFGTTYTKVKISSNGYIILGYVTGDATAATIPTLADHTDATNSGVGGVQISGPWIDNADPSNVYFGQIGSSVLVVTWKDNLVEGLTVTGTSQIALHSSGEIEIYASSSLNGVATPVAYGTSTGEATTSQVDISGVQECAYYSHLEL